MFRISSYMVWTYFQTTTHNMDSFEIHCAQHGLLLVPVDITRFLNNRVMCMTNPLFSSQTYEAATVQLLLSESLENQNNGFSMAERQQRWSCWSVPTLFQDYSTECCSGRKACKYAQIYKLDSSENHMLIYTSNTSSSLFVILEKMYICYM